MEAAKLQADHLKDRIEEQSKLSALKNSMRQSESRRKIELANQRCDTLSSDGVEYSTSEYEYRKKLRVRVRVLILKNVLENKYRKKVRVRVLLQV